MSNLKRQRPGGFTLIEMLIVITIIALLMALLMPIYGTVRDKARRTATKALISVVGSALEKYYNDMESYPPTPADSSEDDGTLVLYLNGPDNKGVTANPGTPREKRYEPYLAITNDFIKHVSNKLVIVDAWGQPLHYFNCKAWVNQGKNPLFCHNPDSFDIYSTGSDRKRDPKHEEPGTALNDDNKDGKMDDAEELVDDITNY